MMSKMMTILSVMVFCTGAVNAVYAAEIFSDQFDTLSPLNWRNIPSHVRVENGILLMPGKPECRLTSVDKFRYGRYFIRFRLRGLAPGNYAYFGFFTREPWGHNCIQVMVEGNRLGLHLRRNGGEVATPFGASSVTPDVWHTATIDWKPNRVELWYDGKSCGVFTNQDYIPNEFLVSHLDTLETAQQALQLEVDEVRIESDEVKQSDRSGFELGPRPPVQTPPDTKPLPWPKRKPPVIKLTANGAVLTNAFYRAEFNWAQGLQLIRLTNQAANLECLAQGMTSELFAIATDGKLLRSSDFKVTNAKVAGTAKSRRLEVEIEHQVTGWGALLSIYPDSSPEMRIALRLENRSNTKRSVVIHWPYFAGLQIGPRGADNYYIFPFMGGWCHHRPDQLVALYGEPTGSVQMFVLFNPSAGCCVYVYLKDQTARIKTMVLRKVDDPTEDLFREREWSFPQEVEYFDPILKVERNLIRHSLGTQFTMRHLPYNFGAHERKVLPEVVLAVSPGDWHEAFRSYSRWAHSWMKDPKIPDWYKATFLWKAVHDTGGNVGFLKGWLRNGQWALAEQARPGDGVLQVVYWWNHPKSDGVEPPRERGWYKHTIGQYDYWDEIGGAKRLRQEIEGCHRKGVRVTLYLTPRFVWTFSDVRKAHPEWLAYNPDGSISRDWSGFIDGVNPRYDDMCYSVEGWREFISKTAGRVLRDTGADGVWMDTMNEAIFCHNPQHQHPESPSFSAEEMLKCFRKEVKSANPQAVMEVEDISAERFVQFVDGSLVKTSYRFVPEVGDYDLYCIHFFRFYFPEIKYIEWGSNFAEGARRAFFNGVGYMPGELTEEVKDPFTGRPIKPEEQERYVMMVTRIMSENADAFASLSPEPLVKTLVSKVYANKFPGKGQTIWTIYNRTGRDIDADVLEVRHIPGAKYVELVHNQTLAPRIVGGKAIIRLRLGNGEVLAVAQREAGWKEEKKQ